MPEEHAPIQQNVLENTIPPEQKNAQVIGAMEQTLTGGLQLAGYQPGNSRFVDAYMDFFGKIKNDPAIISDQDKVREITKLGTLLLDALLIDELAPYRMDTAPVKGKTSYGRSDSFRLIDDFPIFNDFLKTNDTDHRHFHMNLFTQDEMLEWNRLLENIGMYGENDTNLRFETWDSFIAQAENKVIHDECARIYIRNPLTVRDFQQIKDTLFQQKIPDTFSIEFYVQIGTFFIRIVAIQQPHNIVLGLMTEPPDQTIPRSELWNAYINEGYPMFTPDSPHMEIDVTPPLPSEKITWETEIRKLIQLYGDDNTLPGMINRRKYASFLSHQSDLDSYISNAEHHIGREFAGQYDGQTKVKITRSGASANLLGCYLAADYTGGEMGFGPKRAVCYMDPDFYYENSEPLNDANFHQTDTFEKACVFTLSADINTPRETQSDFLKRRAETVKKIIEKATLHPDKCFSIVYDKTADPSSSLFPDGMVIPPNLKIVETISFSKFQRGERNAFYGAVIYDYDVDREKLSVFERQSLSAPSEYNAITFPHITKDEINRIISRNDQIFSRLQAALENQDNALKFKGWKLVKANFYFFLIPPLQYWQDQGESALSMSLDSIKNAKSSGIAEVGDSYGTTNSRLTVFITKDKMGESATNKFIPATRLSYGLNPSYGKILSIVENVVDSFKGKDETPVKGSDQAINE